MHVVGHEIIHVFQQKVCKDTSVKDYHGKLFLDLNREILGGRGYQWFHKSHMK